MAKLNNFLQWPNSDLPLYSSYTHGVWLSMQSTLWCEHGGWPAKWLVLFSFICVFRNSTFKHISNCSYVKHQMLSNESQDNFLPSNLSMVSFLTWSHKNFLISESSILPRRLQENVLWTPWFVEARHMGEFWLAKVPTLKVIICCHWSNFHSVC